MHRWARKTTLKALIDHNLGFLSGEPRIYIEALLYLYGGPILVGLISRLALLCYAISTKWNPGAFSPTLFSVMLTSLCTTVNIFILIAVFLNTNNIFNLLFAAGFSLYLTLPIIFIMVPTFVGYISIIRQNTKSRSVIFFYIISLSSLFLEYYWISLVMEW